jgi:hypothetical protein
MYYVLLAIGDVEEMYYVLLAKGDVRVEEKL